jgi:hypothetical protein
MRTTLFIAALSLLTCDCSTDCTLIGCWSGLSLEVDAPVSEQALTDATLEYCFNQRCVTAMLPAPESMADGYGTQLEGEEGAIVGEVTIMHDGDEPWLSFDLHPIGALSDSDDYRVTIRDSHGKTLLALEEHVTSYEHYYPNGRECDSGCRSAHIDKRKTPS